MDLIFGQCSFIFRMGIYYSQPIKVLVKNAQIDFKLNLMQKIPRIDYQSKFI